jgi:HTH-type transcriptional regulator/antitoxin HigA
MEKIKTKQEYRTYCSMMDEIIAKGTELGDMELLSKADKSKYIKLSTMVREWEKVHHNFFSTT